MAEARETKRLLIAVRTYPTPARKGVEVSCTAAITEDGKWIRIFPVPYRFLQPDKRFGKYQTIEATVWKATGDARPESYHIDADSIRIVGDVLPAGEWRERRDRVLPLRAASLCALERERKVNGTPTLGIFKPRVIEKLLIQKDAPEWSAEQLQILRQGALFRDAPAAELEKVPYKFRYRLRCEDDACKGHALSCTDWEMGEAYRQWRDKYGDDGWEDKFRQRFEKEMIEKYDTHFYVGTVHQHPDKWIVVGLFYPPKPKVDPQGSLF